MRYSKNILQWPRIAALPCVAGFAVCLSVGTVQSQISPPAPANAPQTGQAPTAPPTATTSAAATVPAVPNSPVLIVDMRPQADIQRDLDAARALKPQAEADGQKASGDVIQSKATLDIKKKELEGLKTQLDVAKKAKNKTEIATLDNQRQHLELDIKLLERLVAVRESQVELAQSRRTLADASRLALESELEMGKKRTGWDSLITPGAASAQNIVALQVEIRNDELRVLQAMQVRSVKAEEVAKKESQLIERQIAVLEADTAIQQFATRAH